MTAMIDSVLSFNLDIMRVDAATRIEIIALMVLMEKELIAQVSGGVTDWNKARIAKLLSEANAVIRQYYDQIEGVAVDTTSSIAQVSATHTAKALAVAGGSVEVGLLPSTTVLERIASGVIIEGATQSEWWGRQKGNLQFRFSQAVKQGLIQAETNQQIIKRVRDATGLSKRNATSLVQTSVQAVANSARQATFEENSDLIKSYSWVSALDRFVCLLCAPRSDKKWTSDKKPIGHSISWRMPPMHFNCLTGDSLITSVIDVTGTSKRWFDGEIIVINTAAGRKLTCTPNHPILTRCGWVAAGLLNVGGNVISDSLSKRGGICDGNHDDVPATIHDFIESFLSSSKVSAVPVPVSPRDFHSDGVGSKVAVVFSESLLRDSINSSCSEHVSENKLSRGFSATAIKLLRFCGSFKARELCRLSAKRFMIYFKKLKPFFFTHSTPSGKLLFASIPCFDTRITKSANHNSPSDSHSICNTRNTAPSVKQSDSLGNVNGILTAGGINTSGIEPFDDGINAYVQLAGDLLAGKAGSVFSDEIVNVERKFFHGFVYNLETVKGWYVAEGIITHNCRCAVVANVFDGDTGGTRASSQGQVPISTTFADFLGRMPKSQQDDVLGIGRADLFRAGKISLDDLINGNGRPLKTKELMAKYS